MISLIPTWEQFRRFSLPSKLTVLGFYVTLIGIALSIAFYVVSRTKVPAPPPIPVEEIDAVRAQGLVYAAKIRELPMAASIYAAQLKPLAEKLWADERYADQASKESALIFRLYAATFLAIKSSENFSERADNQSAFARKYKLNQTLISRCLRGEQQTHRGWIFKWIDPKAKSSNDKSEGERNNS